MGKNKILIAVAAATVLIVGMYVAYNAISEDEISDLEEATSVEINPNAPAKLKGSCNYIGEASICTEYYGSYWGNDSLELMCEEWADHNQECPRDYLGGCRVNAGSTTDFVIWHYGHGGDPVTDENLKNVRGACQAIPGGLWVEEF